MATATTGVLTQTLAQLRIRVADRFGDYIPLIATSNGTTTTFIDALNVNTATESMKGCWLVLSGGTKHIITAQVDATSTLTFTPAASSSTLTASASTASVFNKRGQGFTPTQIDRAINAAINDAFPLGVIEVYDDAVVTFDYASPSITVPAALTHVHTVSWTDSEGYLHVVPRATRTNEHGWLPDAGSGVIRILGNPGYLADGLAINLTGYGRQDTLTSDSDSCALNAEYVVARACYHLSYAALDKDAKYQQGATTYLNESMKLRGRIRKDKKPGTVLVRSA